MPIISGGSGSGSGAVTQLAKTVLTGSAATLSASSLSASFSALEVLLLLRSDYNGASVDNMALTFNGDTGTNYNDADVHGSNSGTAAAAGGQALANIATGADLICDAQAQAGAFTAIRFAIPSYASTTPCKSLVGHIFHPRTSAATFAASWGGVWLSTAAITSMSVAPVHGTVWVAGSAIIVYGMN